MKHYFKGFTLVELIIVITILTILATIAFISFQNYSGDARDANRVSTLKNIETGLELFTLKTSTFPTPDEAKIFTGGLNGKSQINQGVIGENVSKIIQMNKTPLDPKDKSNYVYSTFGSKNKYYQIGIDAESQEISFLPQVYAKSKTSIVKGNYKFDPSLPSLIVVKNEALMNSGIFSPEVCFVLDGGKNSLNECNEIKSEMNLKDYDSSLVGYWDMETTFSSGEIQYIKDLSGNQNNATNTGISLFPTLTGGQIGNGMELNGAIVIGDDISMPFQDQFSLVAITNLYSYKNPFPRIFQNRHFNVVYMNTFLFKEHPIFSGSALYTDFSFQGINAFGGQILSSTGGTLQYYNDGTLNIATGTGSEKSFTDKRFNNTIELNKFFYTTYVFDKNTLSLYINGKKISETKSTQGFQFIKNILDNSSKYIFLGGMSVTDQSRDFDGIIDEVKIYNRALSSEEIMGQAKIAGF